MYFCLGVNKVLVLVLVLDCGMVDTYVIGTTAVQRPDIVEAQSIQIKIS